MSQNRGIILHPTSLANDRAIGALGPESRTVLDWMVKAGLTIWQTLPINPPAKNRSPYDSPSSMALSTELISIDDLIEDGWLPDSQDPIATPKAEHRARMRAAANVVAKVDLTLFHDEHPWLRDWVIFDTLAAEYGRDWTTWPQKLRDRDHQTLNTFAISRTTEIELRTALQWLAEGAWSRFTREATDRGIEIWGDLPIFVSRYSCDVWANRSLFLLNPDGTPARISGVPPDDFAPFGQRWGHPLYNVEAHQSEGFSWWTARVSRLTSLVSRFRLDHFRGLESMWSIDPDQPDAVDGEWITGLGQPLIDALEDAPFYAEDLGFITSAVTALRDNNGYAGMAVLQFGFDTNNSPHHPDNHHANQVVVTGTHDNDTSLGWAKSLSLRARFRLWTTLGHRTSTTNTHAFVRLAFHSPAQWALVPLQDLLALPSEARMNRPGCQEGNWQWRTSPDTLTDELADIVHNL